MHAGKLRHLLTLQQSTDTQNARGEAIENWSDEADLWGSIRPLVGREGFDANQMYANATHEIRVRYRAGVAPKKRFKHGSRVFDIEAVVNVDERSRELVCIATERNV